MLDKLEAAKQRWLADTVNADYSFALFPEKTVELREYPKIPKAYASLRFGLYQDFGGEWIKNDTAVWLNMIVADIPGQGKMLIDHISRRLWKNGITIVGDPAPFRGEGWETDRRFPNRTEDLIGWYLRRKFHVVQSKGETRVVHLGLGCELVSSLLIQSKNA